MINLPSLRFDFIGDRIESHVIRRRIVTKENQGETVKLLVIDLRLEQPRTQDAKSFIDCSWWLYPGSQALAELGRVLKAADALYGAPLSGDWLAVEQVGIRPPGRAGRAPKKLYLVEYKARGTVEEQLIEEPF